MLVAAGFSLRSTKRKLKVATTILDKIAKIRVATEPRKLRQCRSHAIEGTSTKQGMGKW